MSLVDTVDGSSAAFTEVSDLQLLAPAPVVSVLMLVYNHAPFLAEAIESVVAQNCPFEYELIIGEDASSDASRAIALEYQRRFPAKIRVVLSSSNVGGHANHRRVFALARGEFVAYCEGDDYWCRPDKLAEQAALLRKDEGLAVVHADWVRARSAGTGWRIRWDRSVHRRVPPNLLCGDLFHAFYFGKILRTCTVMQRRSALQAFHDSPLAQARYRFGDTSKAAFMTSRWRVGYWPQIAAVYRESAGSALRSGRRSFLEFLRSALEFDSAARVYFATRADYPSSYRWECDVGLLLKSLRIGDLRSSRQAIVDLHRHFGPIDFIRAGWAALRLRIPTWRINHRTSPVGRN